MAYDDSKAPSRPRDPFQLSKQIGDILTGQVEDQAADHSADPVKNQTTIELSRMGGLECGRARTDSMSPEQHKKIAQDATKKSICTGARKYRVEGSPEPKRVSTSYVERQI
jgi:hypothetical protein